MDKLINKGASTSSASKKVNSHPENSNTINASEEAEFLSYIFDDNDESAFYEITSKDGVKISAKCKTCKKIIHGSSKSSGNFLSHLSVNIK